MGHPVTFKCVSNAHSPRKEESGNCTDLPTDLCKQRFIHRGRVRHCPIAPICRFGKELFEVYRKFNGAPDAPGAAAAAGNLPPERNRLKKTRALEKFLPSAGDYGNRRNFQTPFTLD